MEKQTPDTVCFTGHRQIPKELQEPLISLLDRTIERLYHEGARIFRTGGAMGFDTAAALRVLLFRKEHPDVALHLFLPCRDQTRRWPEEAILDYDFILQKADCVHYLFDHYHPACMHARDRALVDGSNCCVAFLQENRGGTAYTVAYALKNGLRFHNLADEVEPLSFFLPEVSKDGTV